jgi:DNA-binding transcriptional regulator YhcF (GntR family)
MEEEGFIFSLKGKGNYISKYEDIIMIYKKSLNQQLSSLVDEYLAIGETESSVRELVSILVQERHNDSSR